MLSIIGKSFFAVTVKNSAEYYRIEYYKTGEDMEDELFLNNIEIGKAARVSRLFTKGSMRRRLLDIGITENTKIECIGASPLGDPRAYLIRGAVIALRNDDCKNIAVRPCR